MRFKRVLPPGLVMQNKCQDLVHGSLRDNVTLYV